MLIDIDPETARARGARRVEDRFESADAHFHDRVRAGYLEMAERDPGHWFVVDGRGPFEEVAGVIDARLDDLPW